MLRLDFKAIEDNSYSDGKVTAYLHEPIIEMAGRDNGFAKGFRDDYPSVVICPGGAYRFTSQREWDPVAIEYLGAGYNVFILDYSVGEKAKDFLPLKELSSVIMKIRENAEEWLCNPEKIAVLGFSAGGHLAASGAILWNNEKFREAFDTKGGMNKPNAAVLCYPVITADEHAHVESISYVSGAKEGTEQYKWFSLDKRVDKDCTPVFVWHTVTDDCVPVENTIKLVTALQKNGISYECHLLPEGGHGMSVCSKETGSFDAYNGKWVKLSIEWLNRIFDFEK